MSHITKIELRITDLGCLEKACEDIGLELVRNKKTHKWYGHAMSGQVYPEGFSKADLGHCDHVVKVKGNNAAYEIGLCEARDGKGGFIMLWDTYQGGRGLVEKTGKQCEKLKTAYAEQCGRKAFRNLGMTVTRRVLSDGSIVLEGSDNRG